MWTSLSSPYLNTIRRIVMATLDEIFKGEFNKTRNNLKGYISIYDLGIKPKSLPKNDFYNVKGVEVEYY